MTCTKFILNPEIAQLLVLRHITQTGALPLDPGGGFPFLWPLLYVYPCPIYKYATVQRKVFIMFPLSIHFSNLRCLVVTVIIAVLFHIICRIFIYLMLPYFRLSLSGVWFCFDSQTRPESLWVGSNSPTEHHLHRRGWLIVLVEERKWVGVCSPNKDRVSGSDAGWGRKGSFVHCLMHSRVHWVNLCRACLIHMIICEVICSVNLWRASLM